MEEKVNLILIAGAIPIFEMELLAQCTLHFNYHWGLREVINY